MLKHLPEISLFGALLLSLANIIAGALGLGLGPGLNWVTGWDFFWGSITTPVALLAIGWLVFIWIESLMSNSAGMMIYIANIFLAPFGYELMGLPYPIGLALAIAPFPFYFGLSWLSNRFDS